MHPSLNTDPSASFLKNARENTMKDLSVKIKISKTGSKIE
jgi:hypothetical protein